MTKEGAGLGVGSAQLLASLFALIPVPVAVADRQGRVVLSNSAFGDLFQAVENIQSIPHHEFEIPDRGIFELETVPLNEQGMQIVYACDIANEVQLRRRLVHAEKMASIGRLVSGVAHELNNPLAGILGYAQLASRSELDPSTARMIEVILAQAERAGNVVRNFLNLAAKADPKRVGFDLNETIRNVIRLREYEQNVDNIIVSTELSEDLPIAWGDPHQLEQVLLNLVVNAEDAIAGVQRCPGAIHVKTTVEGGRILIRVTDNGGGIHARDLGRIFDPFFTTKDSRHGTGLGLSICAEIVKDHGGELFAWSNYGSGSTFTVELPVKHGIKIEEKRPTLLSEVRSLEGKQILVIDDEIHITELIFDVLVSQGAAVDIANSGVDALDQIQKSNYDVIICDHRMPGLSGQRLYRLVESLSPELRQRFLFVTGDVVNAQTDRFFAESGVQYLLKPFRIQELVDAIDDLLSRTQPRNS